MGFISYLGMVKTVWLTTLNNYEFLFKALLSYWSSRLFFLMQQRCVWNLVGLGIFLEISGFVEKEKMMSKNKP